MKRRLFLQAPLVAAPASWQPKPIDRAKKGFKVEAGKDRFIRTSTNVQGSGSTTKVSGTDTQGDVYIYETKRTEKGGPPLYVYLEQDEWFRVIEGEYAIKAGDELFHCKAGDSVFVPRKVAHAFAKINVGPGILLTKFQPAGRMEEFFSERRKRGPFANPQEKQTFWRVYGMEILGATLPIE